MTGELPDRHWKLPKSMFTTLQSHSSKNIVMETRVRKNVPSTMRETGNATYTTTMNEGMRREREYHQYHRTFSQGNGKKALPGGYFGLESMLLLVCLTASLLILPLILPPLPPPPFLLLLLPIGIFGVLMILAFMPSNVRDLTHV